MPIQTIPATEVTARQQAGKPVEIIDVRTPVEYSALHVRGARSMPLDRLNPAELMAGRQTPATEPIYLICKSGGRAAKACERFSAAGFNNVFSIEGGTEAWAAAGLAVVRGKSAVIPLERQVRIAAGLLVLTGVLLGWFVHAAFLGLAAFVGAGLVFAGVTDWCGMGLLLAKAPWNQKAADGQTGETTEV